LRTVAEIEQRPKPTEAEIESSSSLRKEITMTATPIKGGEGSALGWTAPGEIHDVGWPVLARSEIGALPLSRFRRVREYIGEHLDQDLTLAQLGAVVCMSPYHFARLFRRSTGVSPHRFVVRARIDRATTLLAAPELSIARIARAVGFRTPSHFSTVFRRITGITPRAYRSGYLRAGGPHGDGGRNELE
jgi:AraC-like DNA-binding protein